MLNVGLTGGIASGKSTVSKALVEKGALHIDFDVLAHGTQAPGEPCWQAVVDFFGAPILNEDRTINREKLGAIVFQDREKLERLNGIVHPAVFEAWRKRLTDIDKHTPQAIVLSDVPLLIEGEMQSLFDLVVLVYISPEEQLRRLVARNGYTPEEAVRRLASQMPIRDKIRHADLVINNEGTIEETGIAVDRLWRELLGREREKRKKQEQMTGGFQHD